MFQGVHSSKAFHATRKTVDFISVNCRRVLNSILFFLLGLFECGDPSVKSRNISLGELQKQIKQDNVSKYQFLKDIFAKSLDW